MLYMHEAPCWSLATKSGQGGDGRTYSGVWPGGQAVRKPLLWPCGANAAGRRIAGNADILQRFLQPHGVGLVVRGTSDMAVGTKKRDSRKSVHQSGWIALAGGFAARPCGAQGTSTIGRELTVDDPTTLP